VHDALEVLNAKIFEGSHTWWLLLPCCVTRRVAVGAAITATHRIAFWFAGNLEFWLLAIFTANLLVFGFQLRTAFSAGNVCDGGGFFDDDLFLLS